jgi:hypothetical protein
MRKTTLAAGVAAGLSTAMLAAPAASHSASHLRVADGPSIDKASFKYPNRSHANGGTVLYDQSATAVDGAPSQHFEGSNGTYDAEGADDFVVSDAAGWTVGAFNFQIRADDAIAPRTFDVLVRADDDGRPGANVVCSALGQNGVLADATRLSVAFASPCALKQGSYWVQVVANAGAGQVFWSTGALPGRGAPAQWRNGGGGFATGCSSWSDLGACVQNGVKTGGGHNALLFQVVGAVGGGGCGADDVCLTATVGTNLAPGACADTATLDATWGDQVNYCYVITNNSSVELDFHTLSDNLSGTTFSLLNEPVPPGGSFQFNQIHTVGASETRTSTWVAQDVAPGYAATVTHDGADCSDRIMANGFDGAGTACPGSNFIDITGTGTPLGLVDDQSLPVEMPFSFNFYGTTSNQLCIDNNGFVLFTDLCGMGGMNGNDALPSRSLPAPAILPLWDDFDSEYGDVYVEARGTAPNRQFIVEWFDRVHYSGSQNDDGATFELILREDGTFSYEYADVDYTGFGSSFPPDPTDCNEGMCATIGVQKDAALFEQFSALEAAVTSHTGIDWAALTPTVYTSAATTTVNIGAPVLDVNPSTLSGSVTAGGTTTIPFAIENHGDRDLDWTLNEAVPGNRHFPPAGTRFAMPLGDPAKTTSGPPPRTPMQSRGARLKGDASARNGALALGGGVYGFVADVYLDSFYVVDVTQQADIEPVGIALGTGFALKYIDGDFSKAYGIDKFGTRANTFASVSRTDGMVTSIGQSIPTADPGGWTGFAADPTSGALYASAANCQENSHLYSIDRATGAATLIGEMPGMPCAIWIAIGPNGDMYSVDIVNDALYAVDKTNGQTALIGSVGFNANYAQDADFDQSTGILYWAAFDNDNLTDDIRTVNLADGSTSVVYSLGIPQVVGLAIESVAGPCAQPAVDMPWLTLSATEGMTAPQASTTVEATIDASGAAPGDVLVGTICANSNDPVHRRAATPVSVTVTGP